jgi:hypothetical protein
MALAINSAHYLFSVLQQALTACTPYRFRISALLHQVLLDWVDLLHNLNVTPVPIALMVPHAPHYWAASDASGIGLGGFWLPSSITQDTQPCTWRLPLPDSLQHALISSDNPAGPINNSDLELAATIVGHATQLAHTPPTPHTHTYIATDNTPAASWLHKGSSPTLKPPAFLLQALAATYRRHNAVLTPIYTPGHTNTISDFLSRSFIFRMRWRFTNSNPWHLHSHFGDL